MNSAQLFALSSDNSTTARDDLLQQVVSLFEGQTTEPTELEQSLFSSITVRLLGEVSDEICRKVTKELAGSDRLMRDLAVNLAQSENPNVYHEILANAKVLTDEDLVSVIENKSPQHALSITQRETLPTAVTDALIENGTSEVVSATTRNKGAEFSDRGLSMIIDRVPGDKQVRDALCARTSEDTTLLAQLKQVVGTKLGSSVDQAALDAVFKSQSLELYLEQLTQARLADLNNNVKLKMLAQKQQTGRMSLDEAIMEAHRLGGAMLVTGLLAEINDLPATILHKSYIRKDNDTFPYLLYGNGVSETSFAVIERERTLFLGLGKRQLHDFIEIYRSIKPNEAKRVVRLMKITSKSC